MVVVEKDRVAVLGMVLHARAHAAPERVVGSRIRLECARPERHIIAHHPRGRVLRGEDMVVKPALIEIHFLDRRLEPEKLAGQLEHVIGVAGLGAGRS